MAEHRSDNRTVSILLADAEYMREMLDKAALRLAIANETPEYKRIVAIWTALDMAINEAKNPRRLA